MEALPYIIMIAVNIGLYFIGRHVERCDNKMRQCDRRLRFAESQECQALSPEQAKGADVMWGWLQQAEKEEA